MSIDTFVFPTSFAQQRLWFVHQLEPDSPSYNVTTALWLSGSLDAPALERSLATIVARHEALRTTFRLAKGEPVQVVTPDLPLELPVVDRSAVPAADREAELGRLIQEEVRRPFDLERGPLIRARLVRLAPSEHALILVVHHIVFDGWSAGVLSRELSECYRAFASGQVPRLPELPVQYADYAVWQREWLSGEAFERQLAYWRSQLAGAPAVLELSTDFPRPQTQSHRGATERLLLSRQLVERLTLLSQQEGATLFMTLLAGFQLLLSRYTGQEDIVVGSPIANRTRSELEHLVGFFVNTLALRTDLSGDPSFRELLRRVRGVALGAYAHQDLPFEKLVEELQPDRIRDRNPFFQVMFALQNAPRARLTLPGITLRSLPRRTETSKFDLTLHMSQASQGLTAALEYNTDLFERGTIARMLGHLERLFDEVVADPDRRLSELPLLSHDERHQLLVEWNATATELPDERSIHRLFEEQAARTPEALAVAMGAEQLTYRELDRRSNQLAQLLRARGVGPDLRVGICLERSPRLIIALLGVLKAGGAYVPLDPAYPQERLRFLLRDAQVAVLLTDEHLRERLPSGDATAIVVLEQDLASLAREPDEAVQSGIQPAHLAYVIYTSGSTGTPKGVGITHGNAVAFLIWARQTMSAAAGARVLATTSINFDLSVYEIFGTLSWGGTVLLVGSAMELPERPDLRIPGAATLLNTVPSAAAALVGMGAVPAGLVRVNLAGEPVSRALVEALYAAGAGEVHNLYGPSETTTYSTATHLAAGESGVPSIGRPIANSRAYVLDRRLEPVPIGVPGELYLGGAGVARGYLGRPALTAERFVPDPFGPSDGGEPGRLLYRTGDRVRWRPDGTLEFLGRLDQQVKVRGFRIEPGEIETVLAQHPAVRECVVLLRDDPAGGRELVAYLVPSAARTNGSTNGSRPPVDSLLQRDRISTAEIRNHLRARLPEYMVPSAYVVLEALPLSPNGKLDRRALPSPEGMSSATADSFLPPLTQVQKALARQWQELLGIERVGLQDNFFELGGHSLLAVKLFAEIGRTYDRKLPLSTLFQAPTLGQLAEVLTQAVEPDSGSGPALLRRGSGSRPPLFLVHLFYGDVMEYRELVSRLPEDLTVYGCEAPADHGEPDLRSLEELAAHHVRQIRQMLPTGPYFLCGLCWAGLVAFEMASQLRAAGEEVGLLALIDTTYPGADRTQPVHRRARSQARKVWRLTVQNLRRLRALELRAVPDFLRHRLVNIVLRVAGVTAFRWSVRLQRPLLSAFRELPQVLLHAGWSYRPRAYPGRITLFRAAGKGSRSGPDPFAGWRQVARDGVEVHEVAGGHNTLMREPHVATLASQLVACLERSHDARSEVRT
jgi:amino acid adenylation domain-containing protein